MADHILIQCPGCSAKVAISDERALGKKLRCPRCSEVFVANAIKVNSVQANSATKAAKQNPMKSSDCDLNRNKALTKGFDGDEEMLETASPPVRSSRTRSESVHARTETNSHRRVIITGVLAIALLLGVGAFTLFRHKGDPTRHVVSPPPSAASPLPTKWRIGETDPVAALNPEEIPERLTLDAVTAWSTSSLSKLDQMYYFIDVVLQARGELVERICQFGDVRIASSGLDSGEEIQLFREKFASVYEFKPESKPAYEFDPTTQWIPFDTKMPLTFDDPPGFLRIPIRIAQPKNMNARLSKFEGDLKIRIADRIDEFTIEEVAKVVENPIGIPALDAAGVRFHWNREPEGRYESVEMIVEDGYSVGRFEVTDAGQPISDLFLSFQEFSIHRSADRQTVVRIVRNLLKPLPERLRLKFALFSKLREVVIPFRFSNLPLPSLELKPKFRH